MKNIKNIKIIILIFLFVLFINVGNLGSNFVFNDANAYDVQDEIVDLTEAMDEHSTDNEQNINKEANAIAPINKKKKKSKWKKFLNAIGGVGIGIMIQIPF